MSALDAKMEVAPSITWGAAWLNRTLPSLYMGTFYFHQVLILCVSVLGLVGACRTWRLQKQLKEKDCDRPRLLKQIDERLIKISRGHFLIANMYLLGMFLIAGIDAYIALISLKNAVQDHSEIWTVSFVLELAGYVIGLLVVFTAASILIPFIQVCLSFWFLTRFVRKRGQITLNSYITQARACSTAIALLWASTSFLLQAWTSPTDAGMWRWILLQGGVGSAVAWLDASYAFNFCAHRLRDLEIEINTTGVKDVVALFGKTVLEVHAKGGSDALLPKYEAVPQETVRMDEKTGA